MPKNHDCNEISDLIESIKTDCRKQHRSWAESLQSHGAWVFSKTCTNLEGHTRIESLVLVRVQLPKTTQDLSRPVHKPWTRSPCREKTQSFVKHVFWLKRNVYGTRRATSHGKVRSKFEGKVDVAEHPKIEQLQVVIVIVLSSWSEVDKVEGMKEILNTSKIWCFYKRNLTSTAGAVIPLVLTEGKIDATEDNVAEHPEAGMTTGCHCVSSWREALDTVEAIKPLGLKVGLKAKSALPKKTTLPPNI